MIAHAQGMHIVSALVANKDNRILDWQYFQPGGKEHPASDLADRSLLVFGEEYRPPFWGHTFYIGLRDHLISPFLTGYEGHRAEQPVSHATPNCSARRGLRARPPATSTRLAASRIRSR